MVLARQIAVAPPFPPHAPQGGGLSTIVKRFDRPEQLFVFDSGRLEVITIGGRTVARGCYAPGWRWSRCALHDALPRGGTTEPVGVVLSGAARVASEDGSEVELHPGDFFQTVITSEHDEWVVGQRPCEILYLGGIETLISWLHGSE